MKRIFKISLILMIMSVFSGEFSVNAQNRWNIYAGGSISHLCEKPWISSDKSYDWGGGAFVGTGYEINFDSHWSFTPQLELAFVNNGAILNSKEYGFYWNHALWMTSWNLNIPLMASFRFPISDKVKIRFGAGPYLQEALAGRHYKNNTEEKEKMSGDVGDRFNVGVIGETAIETGSHFSYMFRTSYPFLNEGWTRKTITLSLGIRYSF